jgi:hypothetical protein
MTSTKPSFDVVWGRVKAHEGQEFITKMDLPFTYTVSADAFYPSRTKYRISKKDFLKAFEHVPFDGPGVIKDKVRGPAYVWAVLHDRRIRRQDW